MKVQVIYKIIIPSGYHQFHPPCQVTKREEIQIRK